MYTDYNLFRPYQIKDTANYLNDNAGGSDVSDILAALVDEYNAFIAELATAGKDKACPHCRTEGRYLTTPGDNSTATHCETCDGYGYTETQKQAVISGYEDVSS